MDGPNDQDLLCQFLAGRDAACPTCGYNLRGVVGDKCPECARPLVLGVVRDSGPGPGLAWFLLLAFGWVFVAGVLNTTRNVREIQIYVDNAGMYGSLSQSRIYARSGVGTLTPPMLRPLSPPTSMWEAIWTDVPTGTLASTAWAATIALGGAAGLALLLRRRQRPFGPAGDARMVRLACITFSVYVSWHLVTFILEFV